MRIARLMVNPGDLLEPGIKEYLVQIEDDAGRVIDETREETLAAVRSFSRKHRARKLTIEPRPQEDAACQQ